MSRRSRLARPARGEAPPEFTAVALGAVSSLYNFAYRLVGNEADAEDLVQETYLDAFRHARQLRNVAHCRAWLFRILRNRRVAGERRRQARRELVLVEGGFEPTAETVVSEALPQFERAAMARLARAAIVEALARLPEDWRSALLLCDFEGFTYEEIATIMECPIGTVRSRIARARAQLMGQLAPHAAALGIGKGPRR
jgi:RNA polymerase sigma-70 factor, ECF subfamily